MKSLTTSLLPIVSLCASVALAADEFTAPVSFETADEQAVSGTINTEGAAWWSTSGGENIGVGEAKEYTVAELNALAALKRSDAFTGGNTVHFAVDAGNEIVFRSILPLVADGDTMVMQGYALSNGTVYADALVKFIPSTAPYTDGNEEDKIILWMNAASNICVEAGYFEKSLGKSGLVPKTYTTGKQILDGSWHRIVFEISIPLEMQTYNAACRIWIDGEVLAVADGDTIVNDELKSLFESYLTDEAKNAYLLGTLFPARASKPATALFRGLGFSGAGGAIDDIAYQTAEPNGINIPGFRYFTIAVDPGIESLEYSVDDGDAVSIALGGKRADIAIKIPTNYGTGNQVDVTITNVVLASDYGSWDISLSTADGGTSTSTSGDAKTFSINEGVELVSGAIYTGEEVGYSVCKVSCGSISPAMACTTLEAALEAIDKAEDPSGALIRLTRDVNENIVITNGIAVTLDLAGRTMVCGHGDEPASAIIVEPGGSLKIIDSQSAGVIEVESGSEDWAIEVRDGASAAIQAGSFKGKVDVIKSGDASVSGGRFYANGTAEKFDGLADCVAGGYAATWYSSEGCWRVRRAALTPARFSAISLASTAIGLSASSTEQLEDSDSLPVINILDMQTAFGDETSSISCLVQVTDSEGAVMEASALSLSSLVLVSKDLSKWEKPSKITYAKTAEFGVYEVEMTMPSNGAYFIKLSTGE